MPATKDPLFKKVALLLPLDGSNGSTTINDASLNSISVTVGSGVSISTAQSRNGGSSLRIPGTFGGNLALASSALSCGTKPVVVELSFRLDSLGASNVALFDMRTGHGSSDFGLLGYVTPSGQLGFWRRGSFAAPLTSAGTIVANTWYDVAFAYLQDGNSQWHRIYVDGVLVDSKFFFGSYDDVPQTALKIGTTFDGDYPMTGYIDNFRYTIDYQRLTSSSYFVDLPFPTEYGLENVSAVTEPVARSVTQPTVGCKTAPPVGSVGAYHGAGRIQGTVKEDQSPTDLPLARRVRLFRELGGLLVAETWSDKTTGVYTFDNIDRNYRYFVVAFDYENDYRAVIADNLLPEAM